MSGLGALLYCNPRAHIFLTIATDGLAIAGWSQFLSGVGLPVQDVGSSGWCDILNCCQSSYLRNSGHLKIENEQCHLFEVNTFDHKDDIQPELRTNGIEPILPFIANQLSHGINVCGIVCVCEI